MTRRAPPYEERRLPAATPPPGGRGGQADLDLCGPVNSFQWTRERPDHTGQPDENVGLTLKLNDLCPKEVGFLYVGKKPCQKKTNPKIPRMERVLLRSRAQEALSPPPARAAPTAIGNKQQSLSV